MRTKLGEAGLDHFMDLPQLWPPSLAVVIIVVGHDAGFACCCCCLQVRELATKVKALKKIGEKSPFVAVELKK